MAHARGRAGVILQSIIFHGSNHKRMEKEFKTRIELGDACILRYVRSVVSLDRRQLRVHHCLSLPSPPHLLLLGAALVPSLLSFFISLPLASSFFLSGSHFFPIPSSGPPPLSLCKSLVTLLPTNRLCRVGPASVKCHQMLALDTVFCFFPIGYPFRWPVRGDVSTSSPDTDRSLSPASNLSPISFWLARSRLLGFQSLHSACTAEEK
jgi:hypothetical protein